METDCPYLTAGSLEPLTRCPGLRWLTLSGGVPVSLEPLTRCPELRCLSVTAADLPRLRGQLPEGLECLNVRDSPDLTAGSLEPLTRCPKLWNLTLSGGVPDTVSLEPLTRCPGLQYLTLSGGVPDAVLDSLSGCPGLGVLILGDRQRPAETAFTAAAYTRLVKSCRGLRYLFLHCTAETGRAVLTALKEADLQYSDGEPRIIYLHVPEELYRQLKRQGGGRVWVCQWGK
ncbi:hypothetical protein FJT64_014080 [Amphibalanus amphitrite]|uniref:Uncharacterized protein n=1 Tax=Amphibalanus amphitrite TaxID=1232801 RepID=A0A6A4V8H0_AMPAM|nr:hypothetical protein FJT64_014080 [Amphibalanus amphitrite]